MTEGQSDLIRYRLNRAKETLEEAQVMFDNSHLYGAANRIYTSKQNRLYASRRQMKVT